MAAGTPSTDPSPETSTEKSSPLTVLVRAAAWVIGGAALMRVAEIVLGSPLGAALVGALIADYIAGKNGVEWFQEGRRPHSFVGVVRRAAMAAGAAGGIVAFAGASGVVLSVATISWGSPTVALAMAVLRAGAIGVRDELLLRGVGLLALSRIGAPPRVAALFTGAMSAAWVALLPAATAEGLLLVWASGYAFARAWQRWRSAVIPVAAHAGWHLFAGALTHGAVVDIRWSDGVLTAGVAGGAPAWLALLGFLIAIAAIEIGARGQRAA